MHYLASGVRCLNYHAFAFCLLFLISHLISPLLEYCDRIKAAFEGMLKDIGLQTLFPFCQRPLLERYRCESKELRRTEPGQSISESQELSVWFQFSIASGQSEISVT